MEKMAQETANTLAEEYVEDSHVRIRNDHTKTAGLCSCLINKTYQVDTADQKGQENLKFKLEWPNFIV